MFCVLDTELCLLLAGNPAQADDAAAPPLPDDSAANLIPVAILALTAIALSCLGAMM